MKADPVMLGASKFDRLENDAYFTLDAEMCVKALADAFPIAYPVLEPCAGVGHLMVELYKLGATVVGRDLVKHENPLVGDITADRDIMGTTSLGFFGSVVTNLPYDDQDKILRHILPIAHRDKCMVAILTRASWHHAKARRKLVHDDPFFAGLVYLPRRPWWSTKKSSSPRHDFVWVVWGPEPRVTPRPSIYYPETSP